jgi:hypothetical protein
VSLLKILSVWLHYTTEPICWLFLHPLDILLYMEYWEIKYVCIYAVIVILHIINTDYWHTEASIYTAQSPTHVNWEKTTSKKFTIWKNKKPKTKIFYETFIQTGILFYCLMLQMIHQYLQTHVSYNLYCTSITFCERLGSQNVFL